MARCLSVRLSVCHKPMFHRKQLKGSSWFRHRGYPRLILDCYNEFRYRYFQNKSTFFWNLVPNCEVSRITAFCHVTSTAASAVNRQLFSYNLECKAVATRQIPDMYKPKPNPYLNANPNANPNPTNPTSILSKFSRKNFTLHTV